MLTSRTRTRLIAGFCLIALAAVSGCSSNNADVENEDMAVRSEEASAIPSLQAELDKRKAGFTATAPADMVDAFEAGVEQLRRSGILEQAKNVGDTAPDFTLPDANGQTVALHDIIADGPAVIVWYRGGWCPYCNMQLRAMSKVLPAIQALGAQLVAISPDQPDSSLSTRERDSLEFHVLSDHDNHIARQYGVVYTVPDTVMHYFDGRLDLAAYSGTDRHELPLAVTYVVDTDGVIRYAFVDPDYRRRAEPEDIITALKKLKQS